MVAHLLLIVVAVLLTLLIPNKKVALKWAMFVITMFLSIRYDWGPDYMTYLVEFQQINTYDVTIFDITQLDSLYVQKREYGWIFINLLFGKLRIGFFGMIIVLTVFENWIIHHIIKKYVVSRYYWLAILLYLSTVTFCINASMVRQYLCISLYLIVVDLMCEKKVRRYLLWSIGIILIGTSIHSSNFFMLATLPLYYIQSKQERFELKWVIVIVVLYVVWSQIGSSLFKNAFITLMDSEEIFNKYSIYLYNNSKISLHFGPGLVYRIAMFFLWIWLFTQIDRTYQPFFMLGILSYFMEPIIAVVPLADRYVSYINMTEMIRWCVLISVAGRKYPSIYLLLLYCLFTRFYNFISFYYDPIWRYKCLHYHTIFSAGTWM